METPNAAPTPETAGEHHYYLEAGRYTAYFEGLPDDLKSAELVMVGNSMGSDIAPVVALGARGVHIPYPLTWHHEHVPDDSMPREGWHRLDSITELGALLDSL